MEDFKVGVLASGRGSNLQSIINSSYSCGYTVAVVISNKKNAGALKIAEDHGIPSFRILSKNEDKIIKTLRECEIDLVCLAGYMKIISAKFVEAFPDKIINIHPSLLPAFPGLNAQKQAFDAGVELSGCTVHFVDGGMDTGPIITQRAVRREFGDTLESFTEKILELEHFVYSEVITLFAEGRISVKDKRVIIDDYYETTIEVFPKKGIRDPQAEALQGVISNMGYDVEVAGVTKTIYTRHRCVNSYDAEQIARELCKKLLVNSNIEGYGINVRKI